MLKISIKTEHYRILYIFNIINVYFTTYFKFIKIQILSYRMIKLVKLAPGVSHTFSVYWCNTFIGMMTMYGYFSYDSYCDVISVRITSPRHYYIQDFKHCMFCQKWHVSTNSVDLALKYEYVLTVSHLSNLIWFWDKNDVQS